MLLDLLLDERQLRWSKVIASQTLQYDSRSLLRLNHLSGDTLNDGARRLTLEQGILYGERLLGLLRR